jgi:hypothetical protein
MVAAKARDEFVIANSANKLAAIIAKRLMTKAP